MKRLLPLLTLFVLAIATILWAQTSGQATLSLPSGDRPVTYYQQAGTVMLAADEVIAALGGKIAADEQGFRMSLGTSEVVFGHDSRFAVFKDDLIEMPATPIVIDGRAFVPPQLFQGFLRPAANLDVTWDATARVLRAKSIVVEAVGAQVSVVNVQDISKVVLQLSAPAEYVIAREPSAYRVQLRSPIRPPFAEKSYDDPLIARVSFAPNEIVIDLRATDVAVDSYRLENPFRIVLDVRKGVPAGGSQPGTLPGLDIKPSEPPGIHTIVLDPGHGGKDVGAIGPGGIQEKDITLQICEKASALISKRVGARVLLTRTTDEVVPLDQRTAFANQYKADLFLSVHLNASLTKGARGSETYFLSVDASDELAAKVAERENAGSAAPAPSSDLKLILWDLAQQEYLKESSTFAETVQTQMNLLAGIQNRGVKQAPFKVLVGATMPAALVEVGFISNPDDEAKLKDPAFQEQLADALVTAIQNYKDDFEVRIGISQPPAAVAPATTTTAPPLAPATAQPAKPPGR